MACGPTAELSPSLDHSFPVTRRHFLRNAASAWTLLAAGAIVGRAQQGIAETDAKATFVFHLTQFVTWPELAPGADFKIGILGADPFGGVLGRMIEGEKAAGRPVTIERSTFLANLSDCQLIYVSPSATDSVARVAAAFKGRPVLIVGEAADFLQLGGMVRLARLPDRRLRLQVNLENVQTAGLKMSSQLLRVADVQKGSQV